MEERIVIIDGNSLVNRAYFAIQRPMMTKEGLYTQGVYGFLSMLQKIRKDFPDIPIIASGGNTSETIKRTVDAGANAITYTPPTAKELFRDMMSRYRE